MNPRLGRKEERIVFCEILSVLLLAGLFAGFAWGNNNVCPDRSRDSTPSLIEERTYREGPQETAFVKPQALSQNPERERTFIKTSMTDEGFDENQVEWVRIIQIVLIGTVVGGMLFLGRCLV